MISITILVYSVLVLKVHSQEVSDAEPRFTTESTTPTSTADWDVINQRNFQNDNSPLSRNNQFQPYLPSQYGPIIASFQGLPYGARLQFENRSGANPRYFPSYDVPLDAYSVNWTDSDNSFSQPASFMQYPQANGIFPLPAVPYYASRNPDDNRYALIEDVYNPSYDNFRGNWTIPPPIIYPENVPRRRNRMNSAPAYLENLPYPDYNQRRYGDIRNAERAIPFSQYPLPPLFYPPPGLGSNEDRTLYPELDVLSRPPYFDREPGTESPESAAIRNAPQTQPPKPIDSAESPIAAETIPRGVPSRPFSSPRQLPVVPPYPAEPIPPRFIPPNPFPINSLPYGVPIPPPELVSPFNFPAGLLPQTTPPPILPNIPLGPNENVLPNLLNEPPPALPPPVGSDVIADAPLPPPIENMPVDEIETNPSEISGNLPPVKTPYEFGYEMNDGRGTDQHRKEFSDGSGTVTGSYGYRDPFGVYRLVNYVADKNGFRAFIKSNEPGVSNPGSADVRVEAEVPPPKAIEESLRSSMRVDAVELPDVPPLPVVGEKK